MKLSVADAARAAGAATIPSAVPSKCMCPLRKHKRKDRTFRIFRSLDGTEIWKCWSCDEPENSGDALKLYCLLTGTDRRDAWRHFSEQGFEFQGSRPSTFVPKVGSGRRFVEPRRDPESVLPLDPQAVQEWLSNDLSGVNSYLKSRGLPSESWHDWNVVSMGGDYLGFVYCDPDTGTPCRVKVRGMKEKRFWNEPRPDTSRPGAKAKAPLWLGERIEYGEPGVIVESEMDALTLSVVGIPNVVSLPDGSESASTVDLNLLRESCPEWIVAVDSDDAGDRAWSTLPLRARGTGNLAVRRKFWRDGTLFKDANDALQHGFTREEFEKCLCESTPQMVVAS